MVLISSEMSPESPLTFVFLPMVFSKRSSLYPASSPKITSTVSQVFFTAAPHFSAPQSVSVCFGCHDKASQTGRLDTWDVFPRSSGHSGLKIGVPADLFSGHAPFLAGSPHHAVSSHGPSSTRYWQRAGSTLSNTSSSSMRTPVPSDSGLALTTSLDCNHLPKAPSPNTITLGISASTYDFGGHDSVHSSEYYHEVTQLVKCRAKTCPQGRCGLAHSPSLGFLLFYQSHEHIRRENGKVCDLPLHK